MQRGHMERQTCMEQAWHLWMSAKPGWKNGGLKCKSPIKEVAGMAGVYGKGMLLREFFII